MPILRWCTSGFVTLLKLGSASRTKLKQSGIWDKTEKNSRFYIYNQIFTQKLISKEIIYKMLTLEWKITMSLSHYIAYEEKNKRHEKERQVH